jgi:hypothetical protein
MKLKFKVQRSESIGEIQAESQDVMKMLAQNDFPAVLLIMEVPLGLLYYCRRGLLQRRWRRNKIVASG